MRKLLLGALVILGGAVAAQAQFPAPGGPVGYGPGGLPVYPMAAPAWPNYLPQSPAVNMMGGPPPEMVQRTAPAWAGNPATKDTFWFGASYALGWIREQRTPYPLLTSGSGLNGPPGALGLADTTVLFGDSISPGAFMGVTWQGGMFLDCDKTCSVSGGGFYFAPERTRYAIASDDLGVPTIARPIIDGATGTPNSALTSSPGIQSGSTRIETLSETYGFDLNAAWHAHAQDGMSASLLGGFRYLHLRESLTISDSVRPIIPGAVSFQGIPVGADGVVTDLDRFQTRNNFYGLQLGGTFGYSEPLFFVRGFGKVGLGLSEQRGNVFGSSTLTTPLVIVTAPGGILAQPSNIGSRNRYTLGFVPEGGIDAGLSITKHVRLTAGYSFLYWSSVVRPGGLIDPNINQAQVPTSAQFGINNGGPLTPLPRNETTGFWLQQLKAGVEVHF